MGGIGTLALLMNAFCASDVSAQVDLEWRVASPTVRVGQTIEAELYAVSMAPTEELLGISAVIAWDAQFLRLASVPLNSPFPVNGFFNDANLDGLNADCGPTTFCTPYGGLPFNDGTAYFNASVLLSDRPTAVPEGLSVAKVSFQATAATETSILGMQLQAGSDSNTTVTLYAGPGANDVITPGISDLTIFIAACGTLGDFDGDCAVTGVDYASFEPCAQGPDQPGAGNCDPGDFDGDGDVDLRDAADLQVWFSGT